MSCGADIALEYLLLDLITMVKELRDVRVEQRRRELVDSEGERHQVSATLSRDGVTVGVVEGKDGVRLVAQQCGDARAVALLNEIRQRYAYSKSVEELKRKGYQIAKEEKLADGSIRVVARRYGG